MPGGNGTISGTTTANTITGTSGDDVIDGGGGNDVINGGGGNDTVCGGAGNDTIHGGPGNDSSDGGTGLDAASFTSSPAGVTASLAAGTATGDGSDTFALIENLTGSSFNDNLTGNSAAREGGLHP